MFGTQVGYRYEDLKREATSELNKNIESIHQKAYEASSRVDDIDEKISSAIVAALQEALPHIIAITINNNNRGLASTLEKITEQIGKVIRR